MDKKYWKKYYRAKKAPVKSSLFAQLISKSYIKKGDSMIELGCGNGRDSIFFARRGIHVTAVDQCEDGILLLRKNNNIKNLIFKQKDFTRLDGSDYFDHVYSRFTLHAITEKEENRVIKWSYKQLKKNGKIFIEGRGKKNELYKLGDRVPGQRDAYIYNGHYRRFIDIKRLSKKMISAGFKIIYSKEKRGFAPFEDTDYQFMRIIAVKKHSK